MVLCPCLRLFIIPVPLQSRTFSERPSCMYFSTTQDNRDQALRKTYSENFLSSLGMFLASPPHVFKNREPKPTLSHSKLALPQSTSMFPTHSQRCIAAVSWEKSCGLDAEPIHISLAYVFCSCTLRGSLYLWHNVCAGVPTRIAEGMDGKRRCCKDVVFKFVWIRLAWAGECSYEQPG